MKRHTTRQFAAVRTLPEQHSAWPTLAAIGAGLFGVAAGSYLMSRYLMVDPPAAAASSRALPAPAALPPATVAPTTPPLNLPPPTAVAQEAAPPDAAWARMVRDRAGARELPKLENAAAVRAFSVRLAQPVAVEGHQVALSFVVRAPEHLPAKAPLLVAMHGTHGRCVRPNGQAYCPTDPHEPCYRGDKIVFSPAGILPVAEQAARQGAVAVIVDATEMSCDAGRNGAAVRAGLALAALQQWRAWQAGAASELPADVVQGADLGQIALVGHSTGADAALMLALYLQNAKARGLDRAKVTGLLLVAPVDALRAPVPAAPLAVVVPSCDEDVVNLGGHSVIDRALLREDHGRLLLWQLAGGSHNAFNRAWGSEAEQHGYTACHPQLAVPVAAQRLLLDNVTEAWLAATLHGAAYPGWATGGEPLPLVAGQAIDWRASDWPALARPVEGLRVAGIGLSALQDCTVEQCQGDDRNPEPLWWATAASSKASVQLQFNAIELRAGQSVHLRLASRAPSPSDRPMQLRAQWLGENGKPIDAGALEILPPLAGAAKGDEAPLMLSAAMPASPVAAKGKPVRVRGLELQFTDAAPQALAIGGAWLAP